MKLEEFDKIFGFNKINEEGCQSGLMGRPGHRLWRGSAASGKSRLIKMYTVYIIQSIKTKRYYVGMTSDLEKRLEYHNKGKSKFTKRKGPWKLVYKEEFPNKKLAWLRERQIKKYKSGEAFKKLLKEGCAER